MQTFTNTTKNLSVALFAATAMSAATTASGAITQMRDSADFNIQNWEGNDPIPAPAWNMIDLWTTDGNGNYVTTVNATGAGGETNAFSTANGYTAEIRLGLDPDELPDGPGIYTLIGADNAPRVTLTYGLSDGQFAIWDYYATGPDAADPIFLGAADEFHEVRLAVEADGGDGEAKLYVDGVFLQDAVFGPTNSNIQWFGSAGSFASSGEQMLVDYFRLDSTGAYAPVPEPGSLALLGLSGLFLSRRRRQG